MIHEIYVLSGMFACGIALSVLFDLRRSIQKTVKIPDIIVIIADVLFWGIAVAATLWCVWILDDGKIQLYGIIGLATGSLMYFITVSSFVFYALTKLVEFILKIIGFIFKILLTPIRFLYKIIVSICIRNKGVKKEEHTSNECIKGKNS